MRQGSGRSESAVHPQANAELTLLVELAPWHRTFLHNLRDALFTRPEPQLATSSGPGAFWPDVFVARELPWFRLLESAGLHVAAVVIVWSVSSVLALQPRAIMKPTFRRSDVLYYSASEYLPPLNTGMAASRVT